MSQADESIEFDDNFDAEEMYDDEEWDENDFDELDDPDVSHRALTEEGRQFEAYAANWMRPSPRRIQVARDLLHLEPDAGISALLALTVDPDLHNDEDENPYDLDTIRHRFNNQAITELLRTGGSASRAVRWLVDQDPNGANLQQLVLQGEFMMDLWMTEVVSPSGPHNPATKADLHLQALRHLVGAPQLRDYLRRIAMGELVSAAGASGYADVKQLAADDDLSWILSCLPERYAGSFERDCVPAALTIGQYVVKDADLPIELRIDVALALAEEHDEVGASALAAIYSSFPRGDKRRRDVLQRFLDLEKQW